MEYYKEYSFDHLSEENMAVLFSLYGFESFQENDGTTVLGYITHSNWEKDNFETELQNYLNENNITSQVKDVNPQNWNAIWEASFTPVVVDTFCSVRADFHPKNASVKHDLVINPKMAFGTGHHGTTWMMMKFMESIDFRGKYVLDYGCGTGILSILASKCGAKNITAVDVEKESFDNTVDNSIINDTHNIDAVCGTIVDVSEKKYDVILANINRHILIDTGQSLVGLLNDNDILLLSGVLEAESQMVIDHYISLGCNFEKMLSREGWVAIKLTKVGV
ncbi:MAG: 50S ribosomal protein L11 methyltransferase [Saprospiraceae bacterium]|nr:50S ribosomal protein L11 methyltransferase [Saprospiraceae bacterium]